MTTSVETTTTTIAPPAILRLSTPLGTTAFQIDRVRSPLPVENKAIDVRLAGAPGQIFEELGRAHLHEHVQASPAVSQTQLFIRTDKNLYCIGQRSN